MLAGIMKFKIPKFNNFFKEPNDESGANIEAAVKFSFFFSSKLIF